MINMLSCNRASFSKQQQQIRARGGGGALWSIVDANKLGAVSSFWGNNQKKDK